MSGEAEPVSSHEEDEDEEEEDDDDEELESNSPLRTRRGKRTAPEDLEGAMPKKGRVVLSDSSDTESKHILGRAQREKPLAET